MNEKDIRQKYIDETKQEINKNSVYSWRDLGNYNMLIDYKIKDLEWNQVIVRIQEKTTTSIYIFYDAIVSCPEIEKIIKLSIYEWVNSYRTNYNKEVFLVKKV